MLTPAVSSLRKKFLSAVAGVVAVAGVSGCDSLQYDSVVERKTPQGITVYDFNNHVMTYTKTLPGGPQRKGKQFASVPFNQLDPNKQAEVFKLQRKLPARCRVP